MTTDSDNKIFDLAFDYVNDTSCSLYLTGKAGTGKTTFLKHVKMHCTKNMVVVAPTGVAAINAGGVTMHSFFQLPFGPYVANVQRGFGINENVVDKHTLLSKVRFHGTKRKLMEELELLVIDEVSMLRSDMLDAIDAILRHVRRKQLPFGGVQVLFIGDLYQLPPVVKDNEKSMLDEYYQSPFFFHANVFKETQPLFIELKKIYRQNEQSFIDLLNNLRNNSLEEYDFELLNERYQPDFVPTKDKYITLASHNYKADAINQKELDKLTAPLYEFKGEIKQDYNENQLPTEMVLRLREGAQVMFIRNDSSAEKRYYNGKLATISKIEGEKIFVTFEGDNGDFEVEKEVWENITYTLDADKNEINEKVLGQFIQFPLRLAWAITIHKSQGLTFTHAIIDAGDSFAAGQVYVALSRCTSLNGVILRSQITSRSLHTDSRIFDFNTTEHSESNLKNNLKNERLLYDSQKLLRLFDWQAMNQSVEDVRAGIHSSIVTNSDSESLNFVKDVTQKIETQLNVVAKFTNEINSLLNEVRFSGDSSKLQERVTKAIQYFTNQIYFELYQPLQEIIQKHSSQARAKKLVKTLQEVANLWWAKMMELQTARLQGAYLIAEEMQFEKPKEIVKAKKERGDSAKESLAFFLAGRSINEIADIRKLAMSTIESHLAEFVLSGELSISEFLDTSQIENIKQAYIQATSFSTTEIRLILNNEFSHGNIRMCVNYLLDKKEIVLKPSKK